MIDGVKFRKHEASELQRPVCSILFLVAIEALMKAKNKCISQSPRLNEPETTPFHSPRCQRMDAQIERVSLSSPVSVCFIYTW